MFFLFVLTGFCFFPSWPLTPESKSYLGLLSNKDYRYIHHHTDRYTTIQTDIPPYRQIHNHTDDTSPHRYTTMYGQESFSVANMIGYVASKEHNARNKNICFQLKS